MLGLSQRLLRTPSLRDIANDGQHTFFVYGNGTGFVPADRPIDRLGVLGHTQRAAILAARQRTLVRQLRRNMGAYDRGRGVVIAGGRVGAQEDAVGGVQEHHVGHRAKHRPSLLFHVHERPVLGTVLFEQPGEQHQGHRVGREQQLHANDDVRRNARGRRRHTCGGVRDEQDGRGESQRQSGAAKPHRCPQQDRRHRVQRDREREEVGASRVGGGPFHRKQPYQQAHELREAPRLHNRFHHEGSAQNEQRRDERQRRHRIGHGPGSPRVEEIGSPPKTDVGKRGNDRGHSGRQHACAHHEDQHTS